ncbi:MAG: hypothetical protein LBJ18_00200, partial [Rickettsiales bacterium]|nr:hypothetical protein [Rickettsiales bacterium]
MTKRIEIRKILENGPETWREYARVEYSASQVCDMAKQDGLLLSEHEMSLYYRFDELDGELFAFGAYENKIPAGGGGKL